MFSEFDPYLFTPLAIIDHSSLLLSGSALIPTWNFDDDTCIVSNKYQA